MNPNYVILAVLFSTSAIMCMAMALAWRHFGGRRYTLFWATSYGVSVAQWAFNAIGMVLKSYALVGVTGLCILVSSAFLLIGARVRAGRTVPWRRFALCGSVALAIVAVCYYAKAPAVLRSSLPPLFASFMIFAAAMDIWPAGRPFRAPERAFFVALVTFAMFELAVAAIGLLDSRMAADGEMSPYRMLLLGLGLPTLYLAVGVTAVLVVAGDLAEQLRTLMSHDALTGVLNRRGLEDQGAGLIANVRRHRLGMAMVVCDLDRFKQLNDGHGHIAGDAALKTFAALLRASVRTGDVVARLGGDEFCVLLPRSSSNDAAEVMERVRMALNASDQRGDSNLAPLTASFGITEMRPTDRELHDMIDRADRALYDAKRAGRDRVVQSHPNVVVLTGTAAR